MTIVKWTTSLHSKITVESQGKPQFTLAFHLLTNNSANPNTYGIKIDKLNPSETKTLKSETVCGLVLSKLEAERIIENWIEDLF